MRHNISTEEFERMTRLVDMAIEAPNKKEAELYINQLECTCTDLEGPANNIRSELIASTKAASGRVSEKEQKKCFAKADLYKLRRFVKDEDRFL